jgi:3-methyladenine DNA glycosylase AlkC
MAEPLKNIYKIAYIEHLAQKLNDKYPSFDKFGFISSVLCDSWCEMALKQRIRHIAINLNNFIPLSYQEQLAILKPVSKDFFSLEAVFFQDFVEVFGLDDFENSLDALGIFTIDSTSEFAIRHFIVRYEDETMKIMKQWAKSKNEHLRRLASEGCRPRLPWGIVLHKFKKDPSKVLEIIELLKNDTSLYVRKSVANNLNDISKDNPKLVQEFVKNNNGNSKELSWICKHASRTLLKQGDIETLKLFNLQPLNDVIIKDFICEKNVKIGDDLNFSFLLSTTQPVPNIRLEYAIKYLKSNKTYTKKVFMLSQGTLDFGNKTFVKKQSFRDMTTRKHYAGEHFISILLNGEEKVSINFNVIN